MWHGSNSKTWSMYKTKKGQRRNKISLEVLTGLPLTRSPDCVWASSSAVGPLYIGMRADGWISGACPG